MDASHLSVEYPTFIPDVLPPELERLREASASGNLVDVESILPQLLAKPTYERFHIDRFVVALFEAAKNNHVHVASYLLSQGIPTKVDLFVHASSFP
jgi:hypothetical protein